MLVLIDGNEKYLKQYQEAYLLSLDKIKSGEIHRSDLMFNDINEVDVIQKMKDYRDKSKLKPLFGKNKPLILSGCNFIL